jgi:hypothetical protein
MSKHVDWEREDLRSEICRYGAKGRRYVAVPGALLLVSYKPGMEKTWTLYYWMGNGKSRVMGQLICTEETVQRAIAELPEDHRDNVYARPSSRQD